MQPLTEGPELEQYRDAHDHHLEVYFRDRDLKRALATYHSNTIGMGTGRGEIGDTPEAMRDIIARDLNSITDPIGYQIRSRNFWEIAPRLVVCQALIDLEIIADAHRMTLHDLRHMTILCREDDDRICIVYVNVSFPTDIHGQEEPYPLKEIKEISEVVDELIASKTQDLTLAYRKLERMAVRDRLTGLFNRIRLDEKLEQEVARANRYGSQVSIVLLDIDHFKTVNDHRGHLVGDAILKALADRIRNQQRETDLLGRWGGEEFLLILPETTAYQARQMAERVRQAAAGQPFDVDGESVQITVSAGIASHRQDDDVESLFRRADAALYEAKKAGRNRSAVAAKDGG